MSKTKTRSAIFGTVCQAQRARPPLLFTAAQSRMRFLKTSDCADRVFPEITPERDWIVRASRYSAEATATRNGRVRRIRIRHAPCQVRSAQIVVTIGDDRRAQRGL